MDKPVADKLNPGHDAAVRRMLAGAAGPRTKGTPSGVGRRPKVGAGTRLRKGPRPQPASHSFVQRA
jgi:hypothetical protein